MFELFYNNPKPSRNTQPLMAPIRLISLTTARYVVWLLLALSLNSSEASPAYDRHHPPRVENFDPAEANPEGRITCLGDSYPLQLPAQPHFNPNHLSMQQLCAKPQYGGGLRGQHLGGWCYSGPPLSDSPQRGVVVFDTSDAAQPNVQLQNPRTLLGCLYKCFCGGRSNRIPAQPETFRGERRDVMSGITYEVKIDIVDDFVVPQRQHSSTRGRHVPAASYEVITEIEAGLNQAGGYTRYVSMDYANYIQCRGDLPTFILPPPYEISSFDSLQKLCSVTMGGGDP